MLNLFRAIEQRDPRKIPTPEQEAQLYTPDVEFHWPPSLPYGATPKGLERSGPSWSDTWNPLHPTAAERRMARFDGEVPGLYELRDGKLARAQMFYFDEAALVRFLAGAKRE